jgi:hypothetical protein
MADFYYYSSAGERPVFMPHGDDEKAVTVFIDSRHIDELETALAFLKKCHKFWTCVCRARCG